MSTKSIVVGLGVVALGVLYAVFRLPSVEDAALPTGPEAIARGQYTFNAAGCGACHQPEGATALTGGYELPSPFGGTFISPNITPDPETGIGGWTGKDFLLAVKHGRKPSGGFYWPAFPFRSYKDMTDQDVLDVGAYLMSLAPVKADERPHDLPAWQFSLMMAGWNILAPMLEGSEPVVGDDAQVQRGAYLARSLGHCSECHTPRNGLGMTQRAQEFAGIPEFAPTINGEELAGWTTDDFVAFLQLGLTPEGEFVGGEMAAVIEHTKALSEEDQAAYAAFFLRGDGAAPAAQ
jgi:mono/diheme cytochrome c family protein